MIKLDILLFTRAWLLRFLKKADLQLSNDLETWKLTMLKKEEDSNMDDENDPIIDKQREEWKEEEKHSSNVTF